jgi:alcohol dehydrogenase (NADP+)
MFYKFFNLNNHKKIPIIGFGTSHVNTNESGQKIIIEAIKQGYLLIDTAELYKTQTVVGKAVNQCIKDGIVKRDDIFIQTKV